MDIGTFIRQATRQLSDHGILTARLDVLILLEDLLNKDRSLILAHTDDLLSDTEIGQLDILIKRRSQHEPLAYIRGQSEFFGRTFEITKDVLVPRPETETMIELFKELPGKAAWRIADIGTGSGAIGITIALESVISGVDLYDISPAALRVAKANVARYKPKVPITLYHADLLKDVAAPYDVLLANLPYVPQNFPINNAAKHEPRLALFAGDDGLRDYKTFWQQVADLASRPQYILCESLPEQHISLKDMAKAAGYSLEKTNDFIQLFARDN